MEILEFFQPIVRCEIARSQVDPVMDELKPVGLAAAIQGIDQFRRQSAHGCFPRRLRESNLMEEDEPQGRPDFQQIISNLHIIMG
jgi:hypothetical protein